MPIASFDVTFSPKVNVNLDVKDPKHLTEEEMAKLLELARVKIKVNANDLIVDDNLSGVDLYSKDITKGPLHAPERLLPNTGTVLVEALQSLKSIPESGYIPFASPAPSSTEKALKIHVQKAIESLDMAVSVHKSIYK